MIIRQFTTDDFNGLDKTWQKFHKDDFGLPPYDHVLTALVSENRDGVVGYGFCVILPELIVVMNRDRPVKDRVDAIMGMAEKNKKFMAKMDYEVQYCLVHDQKFENLLTKRCGFSQAAGKLLYTRTEG